MYTYRIKVRERTFLWGNSDIKSNFDDDSSLCITFKVDDIGEAVTFGSIRLDDGRPKEAHLGSLKEGQVFTVPLQKIIGVFAETINNAHTFITCTIHGTK